MALPADVDMAQIDGLAGKAAHVALTRLSIRLDKRRSDDLHDYLVMLGIEMAATYDPAYGQAFSTYFYRRARRRVIDWLRRTHGDPRHKSGALAKLPVSYPSASVEAVYDQRQLSTYFSVEDPEPDSLADAVVELGRNLSPDARWALVNVAGRMAEGATETQAIQESKNGLDYREARRRLKCLRTELVERGHVPAGV